jgi:hypothetical protein
MVVMFAVDWSAVEKAFWPALFQLIVLGIVGFVANIVYRRFRETSTARQELLDEIDEFSIRLYKPRKVYQIMMECPQGLSAAACAAEEREGQRLATVHRALEEFVEAVGRFRTVQVRLVRLYGYHLELAAHYLAIWRYLKEIRQHMERGESLNPPDRRDGTDAFYRLLDSFRYRVMVARVVREPPHLIQPAPELLAEMWKAAEIIYGEYFGPGKGSG